MTSTDILQFAGGGSANVESQSTYAASTTILANGYPSGILPSALLNKTLRQSSFMAAGLAAFCVAHGVSVPDDGNLTNLVSEINSAIAAAAVAAVASVPIGTPIMFAASTAPTGFLPANGAAVSRTTYSALFAVIGTNFGVGDGSTTFNVPDDRGQFWRGWDNSAGIDPGRTFGSIELDAMQGHYHGVSPVGGTVGTAATPYSGTSVNGLYNPATLSITSPITDGTNGTPRTATETRPTNRAYLACIKY